MASFGISFGKSPMARAGAPAGAAGREGRLGLKYAGCSLVGYSIWCCKTGQDTNPINFALWHLTAPASAS